MNAALRTLPPFESATIRIGMSSLVRSDLAETQLRQQRQNASGTRRGEIEKALTRLQRSRSHFLQSCMQGSEPMGQVSELEDRLKMAEEFGAAQTEIDRLKREIASV